MLFGARFSQIRFIFELEIGSYSYYHIDHIAARDHNIRNEDDVHDRLSDGQRHPPLVSPRPLHHHGFSFVRVLLTVGDWLRACVCAERALTIGKGVNFNPARSKQTSKVVIGLVYLFALITALHEPLHRQLIDDVEEQRTWCVTNYSSVWNVINSTIVILHFIAPFTLNIISALFIIVMGARRRSAIQQHLTLRQHLRAQFDQHKKLLISPCVLVVLATPRLIISFVSGCMSSSRDSYFLLGGYFLAFVPPISTFAVFVLPSEVYTGEFLGAVRTARVRLHRCFLTD
jgi:hypothetical protein